MEASRRGFATVALVWLLVSAAMAQVQTGSITGVVTDVSGAVLPGATVSLSGDKLIGGVQAAITDATGAYRFDRLPPGSYSVKFELQGFKTIVRDDIALSASFVATVSAKLEVGSVTESITVTGESPTVDTKSNLQQTVMNQDVLEGIPSGRDPWSVAKIIPGVQVANYDVGGTQGMQQSAMSAHGSSTNDVSYNIDGATVNWPGGGGGAAQLYYDQGMFEEVNYMTSAIPAEVMAGGLSINMVTKDAGNRWRGDTKYSFSSGCLSPQEPAPGCLEWSNAHDSSLPATFTGNPTKRVYDFNGGGGGAIVKDRMWLTGSFRQWVVDQLVVARNPDNTQAIDNNTMRNGSAKLVVAASQSQRLSASYNYSFKNRGHRRDTPPNLVPDIASLLNNNYGSSTQAKYVATRKRLVYESSLSVMEGETKYDYQPDTPPTAIRTVDSTLDTANFAAQRHEDQRNSRIQFDNTVSYTLTGLGGDHLIKSGVQFARLYFDDPYDVLNAEYLLFNNNRATSVQEFNTPTETVSLEKVLGLFVQDSWNVGSRLTLNLGVRFDHNGGTLPAQSTAGGPFIAARSIVQSNPISQNIGVWRTGAVFDPVGHGKTALKASYSRYALQVGIDRVLNVNPFAAQSQTCPWSDTNGDRLAQPGEITSSQCTGFPGLTIRYAGANGPQWPYSDEITAGVEHQVVRDVRVGVMYYHRTNRDQIGTRNLAVPTSAYTQVTVNVPNGPNGPTTAVVYNLNPSFVGLQNNVLDNQPYLDTVYNGVEITANKRFSQRWQMLTGLTVGKNTGGLNATGGQSSSADLNDPNNTSHPNGIVGNDSKVAFRLSGSYRAPGDVQVAGSLVSNNGYPYVSNYSVTRTVLPTLTRSTQAVFLSDRGDERLPNVTLIDLRASRAFKFGQNRRIVPQIDVFNVTNASSIVAITSAVGGSYRLPTAIVAPRIIRIGLNLDF